MTYHRLHLAMMQTASHKEHVFETGNHPQSSQVQTQKTGSCHTHNHHHHQLLKSSESTIPTAPSSVPTVTPQTAFSYLAHAHESEGYRHNSLASRKSKGSTTEEVTTSVGKESSSLDLSARLSQCHGYGSSKPTSSSIPQPVIVRTYTPAESRTLSIAQLSSPPPLAPIPTLSSSASVMNFKSTLASIRDRISAPSSSPRSSASPSLSTQQRSQRYQQEQLLSSPAVAAVRSAMAENSRIPPVDAFTFKNVLRAVETDIQPALDAIAEICSRSKLSLADEYSAHLPPQGEISDSRHSTYPYRGGVGNGAGTAAFTTVGQESALSVVPEASSSSERLATQLEHSPGSLRDNVARVKRRSTGKHKIAERGSPADQKFDNPTSHKAATGQIITDETATSGSIDLPRFTKSVASPVKEINERSKRRSSITLLSFSTSEGTNPTAPTTTAVAKETTSSGDAAIISRLSIATLDNADTNNKPAKSALRSWVFRDSINYKSESQNRVRSFERKAQTKLSNILKGTGVTSKYSGSTKN